MNIGLYRGGKLCSGDVEFDIKVESFYYIYVWRSKKRQCFKQISFNSWRTQILSFFYCISYVLNSFQIFYAIQLNF